MNLPAEFCSLLKLPGVKVDLRYASADNFVGRNIYGDFDLAFLHQEAFAKLAQMVSLLRAERPQFGVLILDALRPRRFQRVLFDVVKGTPEEIYVANPDRGSVHNFGFAVDLTLLDEKGQELDMGTPFDDFTLRAQPQHEDKLLASGELSAAQVSNRRLLRSLMEQAGFKGIPHEWWHFNAKSLSELREGLYSILE